MDIHTTIIFKAPILNGINYHKPCKYVKTSHNGIISPNSIKLPGKIMEPNPMWSRHINDTSQWHMAHISWQSDHLRSSQIISSPSWQSSHLRQNLPWTNRSKVLCWRTPLICWVCVAWMLKLWPRPDWGRVSCALEGSIFWEMIKLWCQDFGRIS